MTMSFYHQKINEAKTVNFQLFSKVLAVRDGQSNPNLVSLFCWTPFKRRPFPSDMSMLTELHHGTQAQLHDGFFDISTYAEESHLL